MKTAVLFSHLFDSSDSSQEASFDTLPEADDDLITADSEGEFHSFTDHDFSSQVSSKFSSPIVDRFGRLAARSPPGIGGTIGRRSPAASSFLQLPELVRPKFVSSSLPTSALSSPKFGAGYPKTARKWYNPAHPPHPALKSMARQRSAALSRFAAEKKVLTLRRSKSCGEGRSSEPSEGSIDILSRRPTMIQNRKAQEEEQVEDVDLAATYDRTTTVATETSERSSFKDPREQIRARRGGDHFRCGCVFLPSLSGKKKQVVYRSNKVGVQLQPNINNNKKAQNPYTNSHHFLSNNTTTVVTSKKPALRANDVKQKEVGIPESAIDEKESGSSTSTRGVSLEKFECVSCSSSAILDGDDEESTGGGQSYFDLPLELIRLGHNDTDSPVRAAFVFEKDLKGVLKKSTSKLGGSGKSAAHEISNRHVRFSTSLPTSYPASPSSTCITPRLRKAREEFNAFLEAQSA